MISLKSLNQKAIKVMANAAENVYRSDIRKLLDGMAGDEVYLKLTLLVNDEIVDIEKFYFVKPRDYKGKVDLVGVKQ